jgi:hypothetical protein
MYDAHRARHEYRLGSGTGGGGGFLGLNFSWTTDRGEVDERGHRRTRCRLETSWKRAIELLVCLYFAGALRSFHIQCSRMRLPFQFHSIHFYFSCICIEGEFALADYTQKLELGHPTKPGICYIPKAISPTSTFALRLCAPLYMLRVRVQPTLKSRLQARAHHPADLLIKDFSSVERER